MSKHSRTTKKTSNPRLPLPRSPGEHPPRCLPPCLPRRARSPKTWSHKTSNAHASMPAHQRQLRLIRQPTQTTARAAKQRTASPLGAVQDIAPTSQNHTCHRKHANTSASTDRGTMLRTTDPGTLDGRHQGRQSLHQAQRPCAPLPRCGATARIGSNLTRFWCHCCPRPKNSFSVSVDGDDSI